MITQETWKGIQRDFGKATPSSPVWFALVDAILTYLIQEKIEERENDRRQE